MTPTITRRTALLGTIGAAALAATTTHAATATGGYATVILSPHQDDELIRLAAYITYMADRGDDLALITATDGAATKVRRLLGLTGAQTTTWRDREQQHSWDWLTDGRGGPITRLGFPDGGTDWRTVRDAVATRLAGMSGRPELYVATWHHDRDETWALTPTSGDRHPDHVACVLAARDLAAQGVTVRYARHPRVSAGQRGARYVATDAQYLRIEAAVGAYTTIGQRSVASTFRSVVAERGRTVVTR